MPKKFPQILMVAALLSLVAGGLAAAARAALATPAAGAAAIVGKVGFTGTPDAGRAAQLGADPYCASAHPDPVIIRSVAVDDAGGLANVFVWVKNAPAGSPARGDALMDQVGCVYMPRVLGVRAGQTVVFRNSDQTLHNINVQPKSNPAFNVGQPLAGMETKRSFANPETGIRVRCDVHPWMVGYISVFSHPYYAVSGEDGSFRLEGLPDGRYVVETWHETLGTTTQEVTVTGGDASVQVGYSG